MKKIFISILILTAPLLINAQPYKQCLDGEFIRWSHVVLIGADTHTTSIDILAYGDTLLNNTMYKRLYAYDCFSHKWNNDSTNTSWKNYRVDFSDPYTPFYHLQDMYIRESEDFSKLYIYNSKYDEECLISDMNLQIGDSILLLEYFNTLDGDADTLNAIADSIYFDDGLKHIVLNYYDYYGHQTLTFIEGVGPDQDRFQGVIFNWHNFIDLATYHGLNCFQNQSFFYKQNRRTNNYYFDQCWCGYISPWAETLPIIEANYYVFIQPGSMDIIFDSETNADISIYDMQGRLCYTKDNVFGKKIIVPTVELSNGVYVLRVVNRNNNQTSTTKFIPQ